MQGLHRQAPRSTRAPRFRRVDPGPFQITERDLEILKMVGRYGVLQSTHLDLLFPEASSQKIRRRLNCLFHAGYLARPKAQIASMLARDGSRAMVYTITHRGVQLLVKHSGVSPRPRAEDLKLMQIEHFLEVADFMVAAGAACRRSEFLEFEPFDEILIRAPQETRVDSTPEKWRVNITHQGHPHKFHLRPDDIFAIRHREAVAEGDPNARKYFFFEADRATMPVVRPMLYQTSILRKFLAYAESFRTCMHHTRFAMNNVRVLFVGNNRRRIETMIAAFQEHMTGIASPRLFLFADRETLFAENAFFDYRWLDGEGKEHTLFE